MEKKMRLVRLIEHVTPALYTAVLCNAALAAEPAYPTKPIRIIIPTAPGGGSDVMVRMLSQRYTEAWGQQVVVDHRAAFSFLTPA